MYMLCQHVKHDILLPFGAAVLSRLTCELEQGALQEEGVLHLPLQPQHVDLTPHMVVGVPEG